MNVEEILKQLVSFPVFGGERNLPIAEWIEGYLRDHGVEYINVPNEDGTKRSIHCRIGPAVDGGMVLSGHTDVVPVEGQKWTYDPFTLTDGGDGKLYGRGSCDMKGFIACCLAGLPQMLQADLLRPFYFAFSYDEEVGCLAGPALAQSIQDTYPEKPRFALIGEPSMMIPTIGQKGIVVYKTTLNGSAGHSSGIRNEVSAIHEAARLILWLEHKMDRLIAEGHVDDRFTPPHTSIHSGIFYQSGVAHNIVSDQASFVWDVRVIPKDHAGDILREFEAHCRQVEATCQKRFPAFSIHTELHHPDVPPLDTSTEADILKIMQDITGNRSWDAVSYAAEAGQFAEAGFESIICGPGSIAQAHRADEFISKEQLQLGAQMIRDLVEWGCQ